jgi:hypothetical protein
MFLVVVPIYLKNICNRHTVGTYISAPLTAKAVARPRVAVPPHQDVLRKLGEYFRMAEFSLTKEARLEIFGLTKHDAVVGNTFVDSSGCLRYSERND